MPPPRNLGSPAETGRNPVEEAAAAEEASPAEEGGGDGGGRGEGGEEGEDSLEEKTAMLQAMLGVPEEVATQVLQACGGSMEGAVDLLLSGAVGG